MLLAEKESLMCLMRPTLASTVTKKSVGNPYESVKSDKNDFWELYNLKY